MGEGAATEGGQGIMRTVEQQGRSGAGRYEGRRRHAVGMQVLDRFGRIVEVDVFLVVMVRLAAQVQQLMAHVAGHRGIFPVRQGGRAEGERLPDEAEHEQQRAGVFVAAHA